MKRVRLSSLLMLPSQTPRLPRVLCQSNVHHSVVVFIQRLGVRNKQSLSPGFDQLTLNSSRENIRGLSVCGNIIKLRQRDAQHYTNLQLLVQEIEARQSQTNPLPYERSSIHFHRFCLNARCGSLHLEPLILKLCPQMSLTSPFCLK